MTYRRQNYDRMMSVKNAKRQVRLLGKCSIYKILDNDDLEPEQKVAYIRHHYTYYNGNESLFNDPVTKKHNANHAVLNEIIRMVVRGISDPGLLREINTCMMGM